MGADFLCVYVATKVGTTLDYKDKVRPAFRTFAHSYYNMTDEQRREAVADVDTWDVLMDAYDNAEEFAMSFEDPLNSLQELTEGMRRDGTYFVLGDFQIYLTGGMSWGDDPTELFTDLVLLYQFPTSVWLEAGFVF